MLTGEVGCPRGIQIVDRRHLDVYEIQGKKSRTLKSIVVKLGFTI